MEPRGARAHRPLPLASGPAAGPGRLARRSSIAPEARCIPVVPQPVVGTGAIDAAPHRLRQGTNASRAYRSTSSVIGHSLKSSMAAGRVGSVELGLELVHTLDATLEECESRWNSLHCDFMVEPRSDRRERTICAGCRVSSITCGNGSGLPASELLPSRTSLTARCDCQQCCIMRSYLSAALASPRRRRVSAVLAEPRGSAASRRCRPEELKIAGSQLA